MDKNDKFICCSTDPLVSVLFSYAFNLLVYWQLRCVIGALFSISCMLLVNWLAIVCMRRGCNVMYSSADTLCTLRPKSIWWCSSTAERFEKAKGYQERKGWSLERQEGGCRKLWVKEAGLWKEVVCLLHNLSHWLLVALPCAKHMLSSDWLFHKTIFKARPVICIDQQFDSNLLMLVILWL